jgi:histone H3/H4
MEAILSDSALHVGQKALADALDGKVSARKRKVKQGRRALYEIKKYQHLSDKPILPKESLRRVIMEIIHDQRSSFHLTGDALDALREISEQVIAQTFALAQTLTSDIGHRETISTKEFRVAANLIFNPSSYSTAGIADRTLNKSLK